VNVCARIEPELSAFLDGELTGEQARIVAAHLDHCPDCAASVDRLRAVGSVLRRWDADETRYATTNAFRARVLACVGAYSSDAQDVPPAFPQSAHSQRTSGPRLVLVRAAAAALVIVSVGAAYSLSRPATDTVDLARLEHSILAALEKRNAAEALSPVAEPERAGAALAVGAAPAWIARLAPLGTVVTPAGDMPVAETAGGLPVPEIFEEHGDVRILQDAFPLWDRAQREASELALREDVQRLEADRIAAQDLPTTDESPITPLGRYLGSLQVAKGPYSPYQQVQVWPIVRHGGGDAQAQVAAPLAADEALGFKALRVTDGAQADTLFLENTDRRGRSVLVLAGDVFHGGRRDRVAMEDVLLLPGQERHVRALGTGDARRGSRRRFSRSDGLAPQRIRALLAQGVDQSMLDRRVAGILPQLGLASGNGSLDEISSNDQLVSRADDHVRALSQRLDGDTVVGFAIAAGGDLLGIEVFPDHGSFTAMRARTLRSHVLEALSRPRLVGEPPTRDSVVTALRLSGRAANVGAANVGTGGDVTAFVDPEAGLGGYGLLSSGSVYHAVIFDGDGLGTSGGAGTRSRLGPLDSAGGPTDLGDGTGVETGPTRGDTGTGSGLGGGTKR